MNERAKKGSLKGLVCTAPECGNPMKISSYCVRHYKQFHRTGSVTVGMAGTHGPVEARFWNYVKPGAVDECWMWTGNTDKDGYGSLRTPTSQVRAHRVSYQIHKGAIPDGLVVRHKCNTPGCVNPNHLLTGTQQDNVDDKVQAGNCPRNESHGNCKFSDATVALVRASTGPAHAVGVEFSMSASQVRNIRRGDQRTIAEGVL